MNAKTKQIVIEAAKQVRAKYVGVPWTAEGVAKLAEAVRTDRDNIDVLIEAVEALEAFAAVLRAKSSIVHFVEVES